LKYCVGSVDQHTSTSLVIEKSKMSNKRVDKETRGRFIDLACPREDVVLSNRGLR
jgi:hypothetical protein